jgi:phenylacetate-CoA ligase
MNARQSVETMSRDDLGQLQIERLQTTLNRVYRNVAFYKHALDSHNIEIEKIRTLDDLHSLPFTTKDDLRTSYPYGMFALPLRDIVRIHASSGTTGRPIVVGYSKNDIAHWSDLVARELAWTGITEHDVVQIGLAYSLFTGGLGYHFGAEKIGASVIPASSQAGAEDHITIMKDFKTTALISSPTTALTLARFMKSMDIHVDQLHLKRAVLGSEPYSEMTRKEIEEAFHIDVYDSYGISEVMGPGVSGECEKRNGLHVNEDHFIVEIINPQTAAPLRDGEEGELVFTTITKEAFPLIRYRTGDRAFLMPGGCECGRTFVRMSRVKGRTDDMIVIRGSKVLPTQIRDAVLSVEGVAPICMVVLDRKDDEDVLEVRVAVDSNSDCIDEFKTLESLRTTVCLRIQNRLGISARVTLMEEGLLQNETRGKKQPLVIDNR